MRKPEIETQLPADKGLARLGGAESAGSTRLDPTKGSNFGAMQSALLQGLKPDPKKLSGNPKSPRQFAPSMPGGNANGGKSLRITKVLGK